MDYKMTAANVLFDGHDKEGMKILDNAIRGHYIEALVWAQLRSNAATCGSNGWINAGVGWGPWDLQRGRHDAGTRVRVQVKIKADVQLWVPRVGQPAQYSLGWNENDPPSYFEKDFDPSLFGSIEPPPSCRCDIFLFGWHGIRPGQSERRVKDQSNPNEYDFFIASTSDLAPGAKTLRVNLAYEKFAKPSGAGPWSFQELPEALNLAADKFLQPPSI